MKNENIMSIECVSLIEDIGADLVKYIIRYEHNELSDLETLCFFSYLANTKTLWGLQGFYQRAFIRLVKQCFLKIITNTNEMELVSESLVSDFEETVLGDIEKHIELWKSDKLSKNQIELFVKKAFAPAIELRNQIKKPD